jgi:hypothetical protein
MKNKTYKWNAKTQMMEEVGVTSTEVDAPFVQDDTIPDTESYATDERRIFDSKKALNQHYKMHGFECTGGSHLTGRGIQDIEKKVKDSPPERNRKLEWGMLRVDPEIRREVLELKRKLEWGMARLTEKEKERCLREEREFKSYAKSQRA